MHPTQIEINTTQFITNLESIRQVIGAQVKICLPVKANAYGHGLVGISKLAEPYIDYLGVACLDEGLQLRNHNICKPILVFGAFDEEQISGLIANNLDITISSLYKAQLLVDYCRLHRCKARVHLKVDTGMKRVGVRPESAYALVDYILAQPELELRGVYSHFAASEELDNDLTNLQLQEFTPVAHYAKNLKPDVLCHIANSGGVCYHPQSYFDMVRPGLLSYGYFPGDKLESAALKPIKPIFALKSRVSYFKVVSAAAGISYNHRYHTASQSRIVTLPIGYGDGYRRGLSTNGHAIIRGIKYPIAGNICMDMLMVDLGTSGEAYVGDEAVLIGEQNGVAIAIEELAGSLNTIIYEILVGFNERIPRIYR